VLTAALSAFAERGLHGTSTEAIAASAGISQPYLFRLFGTKKKLFLAVVERVFGQTLATFEKASGGVDGPPEAVFKAMGRAYKQLLADRDGLRIQLHAYAACDDPEVRALVRSRYGDIYKLVERRSQASPEEVRRFFATGMLLNVVAAMDLVETADRPWAARLLAPFAKASPAGSRGKA
jgi:AcrR family transcriptional regulator